MDGCEIHKPHHFEAMVETRRFVRIYQGIESFQEFLGGAGFRPSTVGGGSLGLVVNRNRTTFGGAKKPKPPPIDKLVGW